MGDLKCQGIKKYEGCHPRIWIITRNIWI